MILNRRSLIASTALILLPFPTMAQDGTAALLAQPSPNGDNPLGPADAKVTIVEYASPTCPACAAFHKDVFVPLKKDYIDTNKIRFLFREYARNNVDVASFMLARCAPQDKYLAFVDVLFETQSVWTENPAEGLKNIALQAGLTSEKFDSCLKDEKLAKGIYDARDVADKIGINATPTVFINGERFDGRTYDELKVKIDALLVG
jgi:protein-disulfide isomerase